MVILFGGEPTVRNELIEITRAITQSGYKVGMLTNGIKLADMKLVKALQKAGMQKIQIQLDGLTSESNRKIRGKDVFTYKLRALENLKNKNFEVSIFTMLIKGKNEDQVKKLVHYCAENSHTIKALILSSACYEGRIQKDWQKLTNGEIIAILQQEFGITEDDFLECTTFDVAFSKAFKKTFLKRKSIAPCDTICYLLVRVLKKLFRIIQKVMI